MTFRIAFVRRGDDRWYCDLERISNRDTSLGLYTGPDGRGLFVDDNKGNVQALLSEGEFGIPAEAAKDVVKRQFAAALVALGWGPEMNRHGVVVEQPAHRRP